ncbi:MAG: crotonase/enoyl-CoA hydratase family protein [Bacteroidia bacterium]|nr:crotonase/enoyl-CoA hydratase family protein [Bacteroidia bacterium]
MTDYATIKVQLENQVAWVSFNRPEKANALNAQSWKDLKAAFEEIDANPEARVVVLQGEGKHFCSGIDVSMLMSLNQENPYKDEGRKREYLRRVVLDLQAPINAIENCRKPVIAAIHRGCIGAAVDIIAACDMRYATEDTYITVKEIDMGMVADLGTLQRLPKIIPDGIAREMAYTGRKVGGKEAESFGLVNKAYSSQEEMIEEVGKLAIQIAAKSPLSIRGTKEMLNYSRDHSVADGLNYIATWNAAMILSEDLMKAMQAQMMKTTPEFDN